MKKAASIISTILHPLLMPTLGLILIFSINSQLTYIPWNYKEYLILIVLISTCILPLSIMPLFYQLGIIKSIQMKNPKERILPLIVTTFFFALGYLFLSRYHLPSFITNFYSGILTATVCALIITLFWKISIHMVGIGGLLGALFMMNIRYGLNNFIILSACILLAGIMGSARLKLNAHNPIQVYCGLALGFLSLLIVSFV